MDGRIFLALLARLWRQHRVALAIIAIGIVIFEMIICFAAPQGGEKGFFSGFVALLPPEVSSFINDQFPLGSPRGVIALGYLHPFFLALCSAWTIRVGAGALGGEIGRGTMDVLASRPISRSALVLSAWIAIGVGLAVIIGAAWTSSSVGLRLRPLGFSGADIWQVPAMAWVHFMAWAGITLAISATRREAGPAIAWVSGLIATSFVLEFLTRLWHPIEWMRSLSLFTYYRPQDVIRTGISLGDAAVLVLVAIVGISIAVAVFQKRDL